MKEDHSGRVALLLLSILGFLLWAEVAVRNNEKDASAAALQRIAAEYREDLAHCNDQTDCQVETARRRLSEQELRTRIHALEGAAK